MQHKVRCATNDGINHIHTPNPETRSPRTRGITKEQERLEEKDESNREILSGDETDINACIARRTFTSHLVGDHVLDPQPSYYRVTPLVQEERPTPENMPLTLPVNVHVRGREVRRLLLMDKKHGALLHHQSRYHRFIGGGGAEGELFAHEISTRQIGARAGTDIEDSGGKISFKRRWQQNRQQ